MDLPIATLPQSASQAANQAGAAPSSAGAQDADPAAGAFCEILAAGIMEAVASVEDAAPQSEPLASPKGKGEAADTDGHDAVTLLFSIIGLPQTPTQAAAKADQHIEGSLSAIPSRPAANDPNAALLATQSTEAQPNAAANAQPQTPFLISAHAEQAREAAQSPSAELAAAAQGLTPVAHAAQPAHAQAASAEIRTPVHAPEWGSDLGKTVVWMASGEKSSAEIRVNPPELGPIEIKLTLGAGESGQANVAFASPHSAVRDAIESAIPQLRDMLAGSGINLGQATVSAESFRQPGNEASSDGETGADDSERVEGTIAPSTVRTGIGLVDIFA